MDANRSAEYVGVLQTELARIDEKIRHEPNGRQPALFAVRNTLRWALVHQRWSQAEIAERGAALFARLRPKHVEAAQYVVRGRWFGPDLADLKHGEPYALAAPVAADLAVSPEERDVLFAAHAAWRIVDSQAVARK